MTFEALFVMAIVGIGLGIVKGLAHLFGLDGDDVEET